jgi:hypothetical protein
MTVIGLGHIAGVGKDEAAAHLVEMHGYTRVATADLIRAVCEALNPYVINPTPTTTPDGERRVTKNVIRYREALAQRGDDGAKRSVPEVRRFQQEVGRVMRRIFGADFWVDQVDRKISETDGSVVVPDVRFLNEIDMIEHHGGFVVRVDRPGYEALEHVTDQELLGYDGWDYILDNDADLEQLHQRVDSMIDLIETDADCGPRGTINIAEHQEGLHEAQ